MNQLRELLNRLRWDPDQETGEIRLLVLVRREGKAQLESVPFEHLAEITAAGVFVADGTFLPFHRIREVRRGNTELYRRSPPSAAPGDPP